MKRLAIVVAAVTLSATSALADCKSLGGKWSGGLQNNTGSRPITGTGKMAAGCRATVIYQRGRHSTLTGPYAGPGSRTVKIKLEEAGFTVPLTDFNASATFRLSGSMLNAHWTNGVIVTTGNLTRR